MYVVLSLAARYQKPFDFDFDSIQKAFRSLNETVRLDLCNCRSDNLKMQESFDVYLLCFTIIVIMIG